MSNPEAVGGAAIPAQAEAGEAANAAHPGVAADVLLQETQRRESEACRATALLNAIIDLLPIGVTVESEDGEVLFANAMATELLGTAVKAADGPAAPVAPGRDVGEVTAGPSPPAQLLTEVNTAGPEGNRTLLTSRRPAFILNRPLLLTTAFDFTERKQIELELSRRAYFDELTGLPNRALVQEQVEGLLATVQPSARFALAFLDVDNFKHINDYYTHAIGDALLRKVAQRICDHIRPSDMLSRISGDEFLLVLNPLGPADDLAGLIENILDQLRAPFLIDGFEILTSASIGVCVHPDHGPNFETLRRAADTAMYRVKELAKGGAAIFDSQMASAMTVRMAQEQRLRLAVRDRRFCCAFQPKVDIRSQEVIGVEALVRLRDESGMIQSPSEFISLAVELGLIDEVTHLALAEVMKSIELLDDAFGPETSISINVAAKQAGDRRFMTSLCQELEASGCAERFMVEVTEDAFLAKSQFQTHVVPMLRQIGTRVSVDDFGTGYSSLAALADITADEIKIDRSFITDIHKRPRSQSVLKAIEALSDALGMTVIAEGVETFEELAYLQAATRIRYAQGYYFAKPIFLDELTHARPGVESNRSGANVRDRLPLRGSRGARR